MVKSESDLSFPPFRLDLSNGRLWRGEQQLTLRPKTVAVLHYLVEQAGQVVSRDELLKAVWPKAYGAEGLPRECIHELRAVLGDKAETPRYIETVGRQGYRFIAPLTVPQPVRSQEPSRVRSLKPSGLRTPDSGLRDSPLVGREAELEHLHGWLAKALEGQRQVVFVMGEPGIGKTTVVDALVRQVSSNGELWIGRGQCVEHYGAGEAYLPVLEVLGRLCRAAGGERLIALLRQYAPTWLVQMPALMEEAELEVVQRKVAGTTRERMLRELAEALEALTAETPLILVLEDLHWSDYATLDLLSVLAQRREAARLLVLGTYRPAEVIMRAHPLREVKQALQVHGQCEEVALGLLSRDAVAEYLAVRFPVGAQRAAPLHRLARVIHRRTEGNPLFMVNVVKELVAQGVIAQHEGQWEVQQAGEVIAVAVPETLRQMIEQQIERLSPEDQEVLEVASVAGAEFSAAAVAANVEKAVGEVEKRCERLARREQVLQRRGTVEWPDGTVAARYGFVHALYQEILYERITGGQRVNLHRRLGERVEVAYGQRASEIAAELAVHFERGRDYQKAVQYHQQAAQTAMQRSAHREAITHLTRGLELLNTLSDTPERSQHELLLHIALGTQLHATKGYAAPEVGEVYARARALCRRVGESPQLFPALWGLWAFYLLKAELQTARELGEQLVSLAAGVQDPVLLLGAHEALGVSLFSLGDFVTARAHLEQGITLYEPHHHHSHALLYGQDQGMACLSYVTLTLWYLGYPELALQRSHDALTLARELSHPHSLAYALVVAALLAPLRREGHMARERAEAAITLSTERGFAMWRALARILRGWAVAEQGKGQEGISEVLQGLAAYRDTGAELHLPYLLALLAEAYEKVGQVEEGLQVLAEALHLVQKNSERFYEAELYRLKGELTLQQSGVRSLESGVPKPKTKGKNQKAKVYNPQSAIRLPPPSGGNPHLEMEAEAEACFHKAIEIARQQSAKSLELRAVMSLSRLWQQQGKKKEAHRMLAKIYGWFTEGFDTRDLQEAKALLEELA